MKYLFLLLAATSTLPMTGFAQEGGIKMPMNFESAGVLPSGIRNIRYLNTRIEGVDKFNTAGILFQLEML